MNMYQTLIMAFICLKLGGQLDWSWWLVFSPLYFFMFTNMVSILFEKYYEEY
jgi:hypothetical protein